MSIMLDAKNARKRAEADVQLLANRLQHLRVAEERARKKICETKARTGEILSLKKRNMEHQQSKMNYQMERELNVSTEQKRITGQRTASRKNASDSKEVVTLFVSRAIFIIPAPGVIRDITLFSPT